MSDRLVIRAGAACGLLYVVSILSLNSAGATTDLVLGAEVLALLLLLPFAVGLAERLSAAGAPRATIILVLGGALLSLSVKLAGVLPAILVARDDVTGPAVPALERLGEVSFILSLPPLGLMLAAVAAGALASRALPRPLAIAAAAVAVLLVVNGFDLGAEFGPAFLLFLLWTLVTSLVLLAGGVRATAPEAATQS